MPRIQQGQKLIIPLPAGQTINLKGDGLVSLSPATLFQVRPQGGALGPFASAQAVYVFASVTAIDYSVQRVPLPEIQTFKVAGLLGDSITSQHESPQGGTAIVGANGFWNWSNWLVGAPFEFDWNGGVSGAIATDIFSRIYSIPSYIDSVFVCAGDNDVEGLSGSATAAQIEAAAQALIGVNGAIYQGLVRLRAAGKNIALATIPPRNSWVAGDSRATLVRQVNAWILQQEATGLVDRVFDVFSAWVDPAVPTGAVFRTNYSTDGTHPSNLAAQVAGIAFIDRMQFMYSITTAGSRWTELRQNQTQNIGAMRVISGVSSTISTGGTGVAATDMAGGWRSLRANGTPTWACTIEDYSVPPNFVGPAAAMQGVGEKVQRLDIVAAAADIVRVQLNTQLAPNANPGIAYGDEFCASCELEVTAPVNLNQAYVQGAAFTTAGTSPADQPYGGSLTQVRSTAGINSVAATDFAYASAFRAVMRTRPVRVPQNVNGTVAAAAQMYMDAAFNGTGGCVARWARPQFWRRF